MCTEKDNVSYLFNKKTELCTGCGACSLVCKKRAIEMCPNEEGFLFPSINETKCIHCGLCEKYCPVANFDQRNDEFLQDCYVCSTDRKDYYIGSASIGLCTMLTESVIREKGIVYGAYLDENTWSTYHIPITDLSGIENIRNSKYSQSSTIEAFKSVKNNLDSGRIVLFIGTPCQISGLKALLRKQYDNLYTIDLICHGVFSPTLIPKEVQYWERVYKGKLINFRFRSKRKYKLKNVGMVNFDCVSKNGKRTHIERYAASSPSYYCYAYSQDGNHYNLRMSCYACKFRAKERYGDLTIGDPWGINNNIINNPSLRSNNSVRSLYIINSAKGQKLISKVKHLLYEEKIPYNQVFAQPALLNEKLVIPSLRYSFYTNMSNIPDYGQYVETYLNCNLEYQHKKFNKAYRVKLMKHYIKKLLHK